MSHTLPRLWLAPMAGYTDSAMRALCHAMGAEATVSEMISAKAVTYRDKKTVALGRITGEEGVVYLQLFGREPAIMAEAAAMLENGYGGGVAPVAIDINMGCPSFCGQVQGRDSQIYGETSGAAGIDRMGTGEWIQRGYFHTKAH